MPRSFPDMNSLKRVAESWKFRQPTEGETEASYRAALADHVTAQDRVEAHEIRTGKGWDQWNQREAIEMLMRGK